MSHQTSLTLLQRLRFLDMEAWERFCSLYEPILMGWLRQRGVPYDAALDIRQECLLVISREIGDFSHTGRPGAFRTWLKRVLGNRLRTSARRYFRESPHRELSLADLGEQLADPDSELSRLWDVEHDRRLLDRLIEMVSTQFENKSIQVFREVVLHARDQKAVADELQMSVTAVRAAQSRVMSALRQMAGDLLE